MNAAAIVLRVLRNRTGATSAAEALPGAVVGLLAVWLAGKAGVSLTDVEIGAVIAAGPVISSHIIGTIRHALQELREWTNKPGPTPPNGYGTSITDDARK